MTHLEEVTQETEMAAVDPGLSILLILDHPTDMEAAGNGCQWNPMIIIEVNEVDTKLLTTEVMNTKETDGEVMMRDWMTEEIIPETGLLTKHPPVDTDLLHLLFFLRCLHLRLEAEDWILLLVLHSAGVEGLIHLLFQPLILLGVEDWILLLILIMSPDLIEVLLQHNLLVTLLVNMDTEVDQETETEK